MVHKAKFKISFVSHFSLKNAFEFQSYFAYGIYNLVGNKVECNIDFLKVFALLLFKEVADSS